MGGRHRVRAAVIETLYTLDFQPDAMEDIAAASGEDFSKETRQFYLELIKGIWNNLAEIDQQIENYLKEGWSLDRLPIIDKAILRLAVYELKWRPDIPSGVTIDEAVELAKSYSEEESSKFINGVLGQMVN